MTNKDIGKIEREIRELLSGQSSLDELEKRKAELEMLMVDRANQQIIDRIENLLSDVKDEIDRFRWGSFDGIEEIVDIGVESPHTGIQEGSPDPETASLKTHDPEAWEFYNNGQKAFVDGDYNQALRYYELALEIEPDWKTLQDARVLAQKYLSGDIPEKNLPTNVQRLYRTALNETKKIESRTNAEDYVNALALLDRAKKALGEALELFKKESKLDSWDDAYNLEVQLDDLEVQIEQAQIAKTLFNDAKELFENNKISAAIDKARLAYDTQNVIEYQDSIEKWQKFHTEINQLNAVLNTGELTIEPLNDLLETVRKFEAQFPRHPALANIQAKVKDKTPELIRHLENQMKNYAEKAQRARIVKEAEMNANKAKNALSQLRNIGGGQQKFQEHIDFEKELNEIEEQILNYKSNLKTATNLMHGGETGWQDQAEKVARQAMRRFSQDPETISVRSEINRNKRKNIIRYVGIVVLVIVAIILCIGIGGGTYWYFTTRPTATPTFTVTTTSTITLTPIPPTATNTPIPPYAYVLEGEWAKNACWEGHATGWLPRGARVQLKTHEYEESSKWGPCALVEYSGGDEPVVGYFPIRWLEFPGD